MKHIIELEAATATNSKAMFRPMEIAHLADGRVASPFNTKDDQGVMEGIVSHLCADASGTEKTELRDVMGCSQCQLARTYGKGQLPEEFVVLTAFQPILMAICPAIAEIINMYSQDELITAKFTSERLLEEARCFHNREAQVDC